MLLLYLSGFKNLISFFISSLNFFDNRYGDDPKYMKRVNITRGSWKRSKSDGGWDGVDRVGID